MLRLKKFVLPIACIALLWGCDNYQPKPPVSIIPEPVSKKMGDGYFKFNPQTEIHIDAASEELRQVAGYLAGLLKSASWTEVPITERSGDSSASNVIALSLDQGSVSAYRSDEAYHLSVSPERIEIKAAAAQGLFYGVQTLRQLFPPKLNLVIPHWCPGTIAGRFLQ